MVQTKKNKNIFLRKEVHIVIGLAIMLAFQLIPITIPHITPVGMKVIGIFLGTLYLWTTVDLLWPSVIAVCMVGFSGYGPINKVLSSFFGNPTAFQLLFLMIFTGGLIYYGITQYVVHLFLTMKIVAGKPWAITALLMTACYTVATFIGPFAAIFLFISIMADVYQKVGFQRSDKYVKITMVMVVMLSLIGAATMPYRGGIIALVNGYAELTNGASQINFGTYFIFAFIIGVVILIAMLLTGKFILRPNVAPLKNLDLETLQKEKLPPMTKQQKIVSLSFIILLVAMLAPSLFKGNPLMDFLSKNTVAIPGTILAVVCAIQVDGKSAFEFQKVAAKQFSWGTYMLSVAAVFFGSVLANDAIGLTQFLDTVLTPVFQVIPPAIFIVTIVIVAAFMTNIGNSIVMGLLLLPVIYTYSVNFNVDALPAVMMLTFTVNATAAILPAASAFAGIMFGNREWIDGKDIYKYSSIFVLLELIIILALGIPLLSVLL